MSHPALDVVNSIVTMAAIAINLVAVTQAIPATMARRLQIAAAGGAWVGVAVMFSATGRLAYTPNSPVPVIGVLLAMPLVVVGVLALTSERARASLLAIPLRLLISLNALRLLGGLFLLDFLAGSLNGPFPFFAGLGDMITGGVAISIALRMAGSTKLPARTIAAWNAFGALDLIVAIGLGITSAAGGPLQLIHAGVGSQAMQYLPLSLVPTVLVPFYLLVHAIVAVRLRASSRAADENLSAREAQDATIG